MSRAHGGSGTIIIATTRITSAASPMSAPRNALGRVARVARVRCVRCLCPSTPVVTTPSLYRSVYTGPRWPAARPSSLTFGAFAAPVDYTPARLSTGFAAVLVRPSPMPSTISGVAPPPVRRTGTGLSDVGRKRQSNEDAFFVVDRMSLYSVADGMAGHAAGDASSQEAVETIMGMVKRGISGLR